jgi:hypothetical protein
MKKKAEVEQQIILIIVLDIVSIATKGRVPVGGKLTLSQRIDSLSNIIALIKICLPFWKRIQVCQWLPSGKHCNTIELSSVIVEDLYIGCNISKAVTDK